MALYHRKRIANAERHGCSAKIRNAANETTMTYVTCARQGQSAKKKI